MPAASSSSTYGISVSITGGAFIGLQDVQPPDLEAIEPVDDSRHGDTDGIERHIPSGRKRYTDCVIEADDVASDPGISAARTAVGTAAVAVVITYPASGGTVTFQGLVQSVISSKNPLTGKRAVTVTIKPSPARA